MTSLLAERSIRLDARASDRDDAIRQAGQALLDVGAIDPGYIDAMLERENSVSTFVGEGVAIPHGTLAGKDLVTEDALSVIRFPDGVDWGGNEVTVAVGIAARGNGHIALLSQLATVLLDPERAAALRNATTADQVYGLLTTDDDDDDDQ
ncbi:MAG: PTS sugar transporter subunit IIA [Micrococcales bacterium]|nr:PTS sugar transporter subunit IIA [Micrococcales bacterium]